MSSNAILQVINLAEQRQWVGVNLYVEGAAADAIVSLAAMGDDGLPAALQAEVRVPAANIKTDGLPTRVQWPQPVLLQPGSYMLCVQCAGVDTKLQTAQVGEANLTGGLVTAAQAAIGQLLHVNPSGVATAYTTRMLRFDMLAVKYSAESQQVQLGEVAVQDASSLLINAGAQQPAADARINYKLELIAAGGAVQQTHTVDAGQLVRLPAAFTGTVRVSATLRVGSNGLGAVLESGTVLVAGVLQPEGTYISPAITTNGGTDLRVIYEGEIPAGAAVAVHAQADGTADWHEVPFDSSSNAAGVVEVSHRLQDLVGAAQRLRLTVKGSPTARPKVRNLRAAILG